MTTCKTVCLGDNDNLHMPVVSLCTTNDIHRTTVLFALLGLMTLKLSDHGIREAESAAPNVIRSTTACVVQSRPETVVLDYTVEPGDGETNSRVGLLPMKLACPKHHVS